MIPYPTNAEMRFMRMPGRDIRESYEKRQKRKMYPIALQHMAQRRGTAWRYNMTEEV